MRFSVLALEDVHAAGKDRLVDRRRQYVSVFFRPRGRSATSDPDIQEKLLHAHAGGWLQEADAGLLDTLTERHGE